MQGKIDVMLFDICGVLFDVSGGVQCMLEWLGGRVDEEQLLKRWISSSPVRQFELGRIEMQEFAEQVVREFDFPVSERRFIEEYVSWHRGPYEGSVELVRVVSKEYVTASFSNINQLQWSRISESGLLDHMRYNFASYQIGFLKPEKEAFAHVIDRLSCDPSGILYFDDNLVNVEAAIEMKMNAYRTRGIVELKEKLRREAWWSKC
jgi:FMN phosphatase YigB (HAD superfamily)